MTRKWSLFSKMFTGDQMQRALAEFINFEGQYTNLDVITAVHNTRFPEEAMIEEAVWIKFVEYRIRVLKNEQAANERVLHRMIGALRGSKFAVKVSKVQNSCVLFFDNVSTKSTGL